MSSPCIFSSTSRNAALASSCRAESAFSPASCSERRTVWHKVSAWLRASTNSRRTWSSLAWVSASSTILLMSPSERPLDAWMEMRSSLPLPLSLAETWRMPLASISKVTSIWGTPRGAGRIPLRLKLCRDLLSLTRSRSPRRTCTVTVFWLSSAVVKICCFLVGIVVFFSISLVITPPRVSMPRDRGVTSSSNRSLTSPPNTPAWMAAPTATASSGFTSLRGSRPKNSCTFFCTSGMRVWPPTRITSSISEAATPASLSTVRQGSIVRSTSSSSRDSSLARVKRMFMCLGPPASAVM